MKNLIRFVIFAILMMMLGISTTALARKGETSAKSSLTSSAKSSKSNAAFANVAKTKQAKSAWSNYLKKNTPATVQTGDNSADYGNNSVLSKQLNRVENQLSDLKKQQQLTELARIAMQAASNKSRHLSTNNRYQNQPSSFSKSPAQHNSASSGLKTAIFLFVLAAIALVVLIVVVVWLKNLHNATATATNLSDAATRKELSNDADLPLNIRFNSVISFETIPFISAIARGAMLDVPLNELKMLRVTAISVLNMAGMSEQKIYRFYFNAEDAEKRVFLQTLSAADNPKNISEILFCSSVTELPDSGDDIAFFTGENDSGLGEQTYAFSRETLADFLPQSELDKRLSADCASLEYSRIEPEMGFMQAFIGTETRIFDAKGSNAESVDILNLMQHTRSLQGISEENLTVAFWVVTAKNGEKITAEEQLPVAEYIFSIKLEAGNIKVI